MGRLFRRVSSGGATARGECFGPGPGGLGLQPGLKHSGGGPGVPERLLRDLMHTMGHRHRERRRGLRGGGHQSGLSAAEREPTDQQGHQCPHTERSRSDPVFPIDGRGHGGGLDRERRDLRDQHFDFVIPAKVEADRLFHNPFDIGLGDGGGRPLQP
jgi:hypothetical protein